jgi:ribosomal protein L11 methyltransferase
VGAEAEAILKELNEMSGIPALVQRFSAADPRAIWHEPRPEAIAPNLALAPAWCGAAADRNTLIIDPMTSFGAGDHPSTRLNLRLLAGLLASPQRMGPGDWLLDVGTGSGILALGMALLSGRRVAAVDPESASRRAVARNKRLNHLAGNLVHFVQSTHEVLHGSFPLVAANLPGGILLPAAPSLAQLVQSEGRLVISGFRDEAAPAVTEIFLQLGLRQERGLSELGWRGLVMVRPY